jgi:hypothetical protein
MVAYQMSVAFAIPLHIRQQQLRCIKLRNSERSLWNDFLTMLSKHKPSQCKPIDKIKNKQFHIDAE